MNAFRFYTEASIAEHGMVIEAFKKRIGNYLVGRTIGEVQVVIEIQLCHHFCRQRQPYLDLCKIAGHVRQSKIRQALRNRRTCCDQGEIAAACAAQVFTYTSLYVNTALGGCPGQRKPLIVPTSPWQ